MAPTKDPFSYLTQPLAHKALGLLAPFVPAYSALPQQAYVTACLIVLGAQALKPPQDRSPLGFRPWLAALLDEALEQGTVLGRLSLGQSLPGGELLKRVGQGIALDLLDAIAGALDSACIESKEQSFFSPGPLIEEVIAPSIRRPTGEFYTPPWLVDYVLELLEWPSQAPECLVDPTCGPGAFVAGALQAFLKKNPDCNWDTITQSVIGYDISPLAVLAAKVAYLQSTRGYHPEKGPIELPIYVRDLTDEMPRRPKPQAHVLVGNPPWLRWSALSPEQQKAVGLASRRYGLVPKNSFYGGSEVDLSAVLSYIATDRDLRPGGRAGWVLPSTHLRAPASGPFRQMQLNSKEPLSLFQIADFGSLRIFSGATKHTSVLCWSKGKPTVFPVPGVRWEAGPRAFSPTQKRWSEVKSQLQPRQGFYQQLCSDRRWVWMDSQSDLTQSLAGSCDWLQGRKGITTDLNGAYFVRVLGPGSRPDCWTVINDVALRGHDIPVHTFEVEKELLYPLLKGASQIHPYRLEPSQAAVIVPNPSIRRGLDESGFQKRYPAAFEHFVWVEKETNRALSRRSTYRTRLAPTGAPFFAIYNVGDYTFAYPKVVWAEMASSLQVAVAQDQSLLPGSQALALIPDHKVYFVCLPDLATADYLCAILNSQCVRSFIDSLTSKLQVGTLFRHIRLPRFEPQSSVHYTLSQLGQKARTIGLGPGQNEELEMAVGQLLLSCAGATNER